jgi:hypothetical protein
VILEYSRNGLNARVSDLVVQSCSLRYIGSPLHVSAIYAVGLKGTSRIVNNTILNMQIGAVVRILWVDQVYGTDYVSGDLVISGNTQPAQPPSPWLTPVYSFIMVDFTNFYHQTDTHLNIVANENILACSQGFLLLSAQSYQVGGGDVINTITVQNNTISFYSGLALVTMYQGQPFRNSPLNVWSRIPNTILNSAGQPADLSFFSGGVAEASGSTGALVGFRNSVTGNTNVVIYKCSDYLTHETCVNACFWYQIQGTCNGVLPTDLAECTASGWFGYNGRCHTQSPSAVDINNQADCAKFGSFWFNSVCNPLTVLTDRTNCTSNGFQWYNLACHSSNPTSASILNSQTDCAAYSYYWYASACNSALPAS